MDLSPIHEAHDANEIRGKRSTIRREATEYIYLKSNDICETDGIPAKDFILQKL